MYIVLSSFYTWASGSRIINYFHAVVAQVIDQSDCNTPLSHVINLLVHFFLYFIRDSKDIFLLMFIADLVPCTTAADQSARYYIFFTVCCEKVEYITDWSERTNGYAVKNCNTVLIGQCGALTESSK